MNAPVMDRGDGLDWLRQCDAICDAFEAAWQGDSRPRLSEFVPAESAAQQAELLRLLLPLDWEYRQDRGETPAVEEYVAMWPDQAGLIHDVLKPPQQQSSRSLDSTVTAVQRPDAQPPTLGTQFGEYQLLRELGRGGMGVVYLARHERLGRLAALKVIRSGDLASGEEIRRFEAEAAAAAQLDHPGIVPVFESGAYRTYHFLAMAFVDGQSLWQQVQDRPLEPRVAAKLIEQVATAIHYAHERGVVHRDLKPHNILVTPDGQPRVTDFGLAKRSATDSSLTATGQILGTPSYMPPEQASGHMDRVGPSADIYSLGATLYCTLTGRPPFQAAKPWETLRLVCEQDPVPPRTLNPSIDRDLETICLKSLRKDPAQRYATSADLAADLQRYLANVPIHARPVSQLERGWRWCLRNKVVAGVSALAATFLLTTTAVSVWAYIRQAYLTGQMTTLAGKEQTQRKRAELQLHYSQLARGANALDAGNLTAAFEALNDTSPFDVRGWEYSYLQRRSAGTPLTLTGPRTPIVSVACSPDGRWIATGALAKDVDVWSIETGERRHHFEMQGGSVSRITFHPQRDELIGTSLGGQAVAWNLATGQPRLTWSLDTGESEAVGSEARIRYPSGALNHDGTLLATSSPVLKTVTLWDVETATVRSTYRGHTMPVVCVAFSPDGQTAASGAIDGNQKFELQLWNVETGSLIRQTRGRFTSIHLIEFSPDGRSLVTQPAATLWDVDTLKELRDFGPHPEWVTSLAFSPDGTQLVSTSFDGAVRLWDTNDGRLLKTFPQHAEQVQEAAFSPDGYSLASVSGKLPFEGAPRKIGPGMLKVWDLRSAGDESRIVVDERNLDPVTNYINAVTFQPGTSIVAFGGWRKVVRVVDVISGEDIGPPIEFGSVVTGLDFHPRLPILAITGAIGGPNGGLALCDLRTRTLTPLRGHSGPLASAHFSPDGSVLATTGHTDRIIKLWQSETSKELGTLTGHTMSISSIAFTPDGRRLISHASPIAEEQKTPEDAERDEHKAWDVASRRELTGKTVETTSRARGLLSPDGTIQANGTANHTIEIWNVADGSLRHILRGHLSDVPGLAFSLDSRRLISSSRDRTIRIWDPREGIEVLRLGFDDLDSPNDVAISDDGSLLVCGTQSGRVHCWDARGAGNGRRLIGHTLPIDAFGFTSDNRLLSRDSGGALYQWSLLTGESHSPAVTEDPTPLPSDSPDHLWTVDIDRQDETVLHVVRHESGMLPFRPWQEAASLRRKLLPTWHLEDANAAEKREDWFAAAFHLQRLLLLKPEDAALKARWEAAQAKLNP